jgi:hypothetical protein
MNVSCADFFASTGWRCAQIVGSSGPVLYVSTPFVLAGGRPLDFYVVEHGDEVELTDDGGSMLALRSLGYPLDDKRNWRGLESLATDLGISLGEDGAFSIAGSREKVSGIANLWLRFLGRVVQWDADRVAEKDTDLSLAIEVERILRSVAPNRLLEYRPVVAVREIEYPFDFRWGGMLIDAVPLHAAATNARLRKALIVGRADLDRTMLFVFDDRNSVDKADREVAVMGQVARAVALRNLHNISLAA